MMLLIQRSQRRTYSVQTATRKVIQKRTAGQKEVIKLAKARKAMETEERAKEKAKAKALRKLPRPLRRTRNRTVFGSCRLMMTKTGLLS